MTGPDGRCGATSKRSGERCRAMAVLGTDPPRCRHHLGRKLSVVKAEIAAQRTADKLFADYPDIDPRDDNALDDLLKIKNQIMKWNAVCETMVGSLNEVRYKSRSAGEQLRAEIALFERSQDRAARVLTDLVKLGIEQRIERTYTAIRDRDTDTLTAVITRSLTELGHPIENVAIRATVTRHLRLAADEQREAG